MAKKENFMSFMTLFGTPLAMILLIFNVIACLLIYAEVESFSTDCGLVAVFHISSYRLCLTDPLVKDAVNLLTGGLLQ